MSAENQPKTLVAFFSRAGQNYVSGSIVDLPRGNAAVLAGYAAEVTGGDLFEIAAADPYPTDYHACTDQARVEKNASARPALAEELTPGALAAYDEVVLIYPNWWGTMPMPVYTFLESGDFADKVIRPLCTHEGSGMSATERDIARACPGAVVERGLAVVGSEAPRSRDRVVAWLSEG